MAKKKPDKDKPLLNGFTVDEVIILYRFIANHDSIIQKYDWKKHKAGFNAMIPDAQINVCRTQKDVANHKNDDMSNEIYLTKRRNYVISFIVHLRNSIAHGIIKATDDVVTIEDRFVDKMQRTKFEFPTAIGKFDKEKVFKVIEYMLSI